MPRARVGTYIEVRLSRLACLYAIDISEMHATYRATYNSIGLIKETIIYSRNGNFKDPSTRADLAI